MKNLFVIILLASATISQVSAQSESSCFPCPPECCRLTCTSNAQAGISPEAASIKTKVTVMEQTLEATKCSSNKVEAEAQNSTASINDGTVNTDGTCCAAGQKAKAENHFTANADTPATAETNLRLVPNKR